MPALSSTAASALACSSAVNTGLRTRRARSALSATSASNRSRSALTVSTAPARARARTARSHSGPPCRIRLRFRLPRAHSFGQFRRLGTVADGGRQALEIQVGLCILVEDAGAPLQPTKIARLLTHRQLRCNMTKRPRGSGIPAAATLARRLRRCYTGPALLRPPSLPEPPACPTLRPRRHRRDRPAHAGGGEPGWGLTWPAMKIALNEIPPFSMRVGTSVLATVMLARGRGLQHRDVSIAGRRACISSSPAA